MSIVRLLVSAAVLAMATLGSTGCGQSTGNSAVPAAAATGVRAVRLAGPIAKPELVLTDTTSKSYDLRARTAARVTLLYFGYTFCPDVCPTTMADLALAVRSLPAATRAKVTVVFVTSDPTRDNPAVIKRWLSHFNPSFVGLTGDQAAIYAAAEQVGVPLKAPRAVPDGTYEVEHGAQVLAFGLDGTARYAYVEGTPAADYAHDLALLAENKA